MAVDIAMKTQSPSQGAQRLRRLLAPGDKRWFSLVIGLVLAVLVLPPLLFLVQGAVTTAAPDGSLVFTLERFGAILGQRALGDPARACICAAVFLRTTDAQC